MSKLKKRMSRLEVNLGVFDRYERYFITFEDDDGTSSETMVHYGDGNWRTVTPEELADDGPRTKRAVVSFICAKPEKGERA